MQVRYGCVDDDVVLCIAKPIYQDRDGHECVFKKQRTHIMRTVLLFFDYVPNKPKKKRNTIMNTLIFQLIKVLIIAIAVIIDFIFDFIYDYTHDRIY